MSHVSIHVSRETGLTLAVESLLARPTLITSTRANLRRLTVKILLTKFGEPPSIDGETDRAREGRLRAQQLKLLGLGTWFDGSPILNRSWTAFYWIFMYDMRLFEPCELARRECATPRLHMIAPADDTLAETTNLNRVRNDDLHTLNMPLRLEKTGLCFQQAHTTYIIK